MSTESTTARVLEVGIVPVVRAQSADEARRAADAVMEGGLDVLEITMTVPRALEVIEELRKRLGDRVLLAAGTVLSARMAARCIDAGAELIVSPGLDMRTIELCQCHDVAIFPGVFSPTEAIQADAAGVPMVKVFPCSAAGGPRYLRALSGPLPHLKMMPTGGVNLATAQAYIAAGASALGVGSEMVDLRALREGRPELIVERAREFSRLVREARSMISRPEPQGSMPQTAAPAR